MQFSACLRHSKSHQAAIIGYFVSRSKYRIFYLLLVWDSLPVISNFHRIFIAPCGYGRVCDRHGTEIVVTKCMSTVFQINLCIKVPGKRRREALSLLLPLAASTRLLPECISCALYQDLEDRGLLWLVEEWISEESLLQHVKSDTFRMIFEAMEMSVDVPDLRFRSLQEMGGLEIVEQARQGMSS